MNPIRLVLSGGQTGADIAGWKTARRFGLSVSGYMPKGWLTLAGPRPEYADLYGAIEHPQPGYPPRTKSNVLWAEAVLWFGEPTSAGGKLTLGLADEFSRPHHVVPHDGHPLIEAAGWLNRALRDTEGVLLIAGNRDTNDGDVEKWVSSWLADFFRDQLGLEEVRQAELVTDSRPAAG